MATKVLKKNYNYEVSVFSFLYIIFIYYDK